MILLWIKSAPMRYISDEELDSYLFECIVLLRGIYDENSLKEVPPGLLLHFRYGDEKARSILGIGSSIPREHAEKVKLYREIGQRVAEKWEHTALEAVFCFSEVRFHHTGRSAYDHYDLFLLSADDERNREEAFMITGMTPDGRNNGAMAYIDRLLDNTIVLEDFDVTRCGELEVVQDSILSAFYDGYGRGTE
jgi:hypothetical protein